MGLIEKQLYIFWIKKNAIKNGRMGEWHILNDIERKHVRKCFRRPGKMYRRL